MKTRTVKFIVEIREYDIDGNKIDIDKVVNSMEKDLAAYWDCASLTIRGDKK